MFIHHGQRIGTDEIDDLREFLLNVWGALHGLINLQLDALTKPSFLGCLKKQKCLAVACSSLNDRSVAQLVSEKIGRSY